MQARASPRHEPVPSRHPPPVPASTVQRCQHRVGTFGAAQVQDLNAGIRRWLPYRRPPMRSSGWNARPHTRQRVPRIDECGTMVISRMKRSINSEGIAWVALGLHALTYASGRYNQPEVSGKRHGNRSVFHDQEEGFVITDQAQVHSGALFDGPLLIAQITALPRKGAHCEQTIRRYLPVVRQWTAPAPKPAQSCPPRSTGEPVAGVSQTSHDGPEQLHC